MDVLRDPATANSRIYIGNLPDNCRTEVLDRFSKFGNIKGIVLNRGFGFIQYERPEMASEAIQNEDGNNMSGRRIIVRNAMQNNEKGGGNNMESGGGNRGRNRNNWMNNNRGGGNGGGGGGGEKNLNQGNLPWNERDRSPLDNRDRGGVNTNKNREEWPPQRDNFNNFGNPNAKNFDQFNNPGGSNSGGSEFRENFNQQSEQNDCEIIVVSRTLTEYAEMIESHLKRRGLSVDLLFPNDDVPIGKVLANISSRGTLYAILVTPQNEEHRSITVNILYGTPAEHRNMPVEDALNFIVGNFQQKLKCDQAGVLPPPAVPLNTAAPGVPALSERHPDSIQILINLLANNRSLTVLQYDRVIQYLTERRELQTKVEIGEEDVRIKPIKIDEEAELQKKILSILNKPSIVAMPEPTPVIQPLMAKSHQSNSHSSGNSGSSNLLHDPKVQKALDSLLSGNLLSNLGSNYNY